LRANTGISISGNELQRINAVLPGSDFSAGGVVYTPITSVSGLGTQTPIPGYALVFDATPLNLSTAPAIYTVGASLDGNNKGTLFVLAKKGTSARFDANTWISITGGTASNGDATASVTLETPSQTAGSLTFPSIMLGTLTIDTVTNAASFTLPDGESIALAALSGQSQVTDPAETPEEVLLSYFPDLGDNTLAASNLVKDNFAYLNPAGTAYTLSPTSTVPNGNDTAATVTYTIPSVAGAVIAGQSTAVIDVNGHNETVPATNVLAGAYNSGQYDISQDTVSNIQTLNMTDGVDLTSAQFNDPIRQSRYARNRRRLGHYGRHFGKRQRYLRQFRQLRERDLRCRLQHRQHVYTGGRRRQRQHLRQQQQRDLSGSDASAKVTGDSDGTTLEGNNDTATLAGDSDIADLKGASEARTVTGTEANVRDDGTGGNSITLSGSSNFAFITMFILLSRAQ
jgi:hypothetical protein